MIIIFARGVSVLKSILIKTRRKSGLTVTELLISIIIFTIIVALITMISSMAFKNAARLNESMALDSEVVKLQTSLRQIITRNWTASQTVGSEDPDATITVENQSLVFYTAVPINGEDTFWETVVSTLSYHDSQLIFQFPNSENNGIVTDNIVDYLENFEFDLENNWIIYKATFKTEHLTRQATGAVRFY